MKRARVLTILAIALVTSVGAQSPPGSPSFSTPGSLVDRPRPAAGEIHQPPSPLRISRPGSPPAETAPYAPLVKPSLPVRLDGEVPPSPSPIAAFPLDFTPWWQPAAVQPLRSPDPNLQVDLDALILDALRHSAHVRAISDNSMVTETAVTRAAAEFDPQAFVESKFVHSDVPTGSALDAGFNIPRLRQEDWFYQAGTRRKNRYGGVLSLAQQVGLRDSNSEFFLPRNQGNSRLTLSYNQPLLARSGTAYNSSLVVLAQLDTQIALDRTKGDLQNHLLDLTEALWQLYLQRCRLLQKQRHLERAETILTRLENRGSVDTTASQVVRARAAVALRQTELIRSAAEIRNAEARIRALVGSPILLADRSCELIPVDTPQAHFVPVTMQDALLTALENRPEVDAATREIDAARVRLDVACNELMPVLDIVLETYLNGLRGNNNIGNALTDQFIDGGPSYTAGLVFEVPLGQRAARANHQKRLRELRQLTSKFQATVDMLNADVEVAVREVETTYWELQANYHAMLAAEADCDYLQQRWELLPGDDRAASLLLEDLLDSQDRLANAEFDFAEARVDYTLSLTRLNRATGTLLKHERIELVRAHDGQSTALQFDRQPAEIERLPPVESSVPRPTDLRLQEGPEPVSTSPRAPRYDGMLQ